MRLIKASMVTAVFFAVVGWSTVALGQEEDRFAPTARPEGSTGFGPAYASEASMRPRFSGGLHLGFGGDGSFSPAAQGVDNDLNVTTGVHARMEFPLHPMIAMGIMTQGSWWNTDGLDNRGVDRSFLWDFDVYPKGRLPFRISGVDGAFYLSVPAGFTAGLLNDGIAATQNVDSLGNGPGWNIGLMAGAEVFATEQSGAMIEMGWMRHWTTHSASSGPDVDMELNQFVVNVGGTIGI